MNKGFIIRKIIKLSFILILLVIFYVIGCNAVKGETVDVTPDFNLTPLPEYTPEPSTEIPVSSEFPSADPPIFFMPPHNENIQVRYYGWWRNASGTVLYQSPSGSVGSTPPYYTSYPYTDGDVVTIPVSLDKAGTSIPYNAQYDFDIIVNMNKSPISDAGQFETYKVSFLFGDFELLDDTDPSLKVDYYVTISVKVSGVVEDGSYVSKNYSYSIDRKNFQKSCLAEAEIKGLSEFYSINRLDCTLSIEAVLPESLSSTPSKTPPMWHLDVHDLHFTDRLEYGTYGVVSGMFIPSNETLSEFVNSKIGQDLPSGYDTSLSMIQDVLVALITPPTTKGAKITIPSWSFMLNGKKCTVFKGGWFDLSNFSYYMNGGTGVYPGNKDLADDLYGWCRTISSILITIEFVSLVFSYFLSLIHGERFYMIGALNDVDTELSKDARKRRRR